MAKTREIKGRMKAVGNIKRITKTMQMIASAQFQALQRRATAAKPFTQQIAKLVAELSARAGGDESTLSHPLLASPEPKVGRELLLVISSNRGLCGAYNGNILRVASNELRRTAAANGQVQLEVVGKKGQNYFKFAGVPVEKFHSQIGDKPVYAEVEHLAERLMKEFTAGQYDAVKVAYMSFESMSRQSAVVRHLLPLEDPTAGADAEPVAVPDYEFSPDAETLLAELLPMTVKTTLFQWFNEAVVSEQLARMVAMKAATDNAGQMGKALAREFNRARQTAITTELSEIIGGTAALE